MVKFLRLSADRILGDTDIRSLLVRKNILISFLLKGGSVLITFLLVPLTINYINPTQYGIWLTISSMIYWISVFDIGIGNGLKNEIAYSIAANEELNIKKYVSTGYAVLTMISILIFLLCFAFSFVFDWNTIFNISAAMNLDIFPIMILFIGFFCIQFVLQLIDAVLSATQQIFISSLILFSGQLLTLTIIYILTLVVPGSLLLLVIVTAGSSVTVVLLASLYLYKTRLKLFAPSYRFVDFSYLKKILNTGGAFFVIQISSMALIHSNNFIITKILGPEAVTVYYVPFRMFSFITMLFTIIITPYWSAFTNAYAKKDLAWIKDNVNKLRKVWLFLAVLGFIMLFYSDFLLNIWIHNSVTVPKSLSMSMLLYVIIYSWQTLHVYFLNGIGKIRLQLYIIIMGAVLNIPLSIFLGNRYGLAGIVNANSIIFLFMGAVFTMQYHRIINEKAFKIWNR
jgi:O-antigen/teichoic acid export membrane protein